MPLWMRDMDGLRLGEMLGLVALVGVLLSDELRERIALSTCSRSSRDGGVVRITERMWLGVPDAEVTVVMPVEEAITVVPLWVRLSAVVGVNERGVRPSCGSA